MGFTFSVLSRHRWFLGAVVSLLALAGFRFWLERPPEPVAVPEATPAEVGVLSPVARPAVQVADASLAGLAFADVTEGVGLADFRPRGGGQHFALPTMTAGIALTTLEGRQTVLATSPSGPVTVYQLQRGRFRDVTATLGLQDVGVATAAAFADLDGDGDVDLLLGRREVRVVSVLHNEGGIFSDVTESVGVQAGTNAPNPGDRPDTRGLALADVNNDGHLDFLVGDLNGSMFGGGEYSPDEGGDRAACDFNEQLQTLKGPDVDGISQTRLYLGSSSGRFVDATRDWHLDADTMLVATPQFVDVDGDGWQDLLMTGPLCSNRVLLNDRGRRFVEVADSGAGDIPQGYGSVVRDFDGDQVPDWLITGISYPTATGECPSGNPLSSCAGNFLLHGNGDGTFSPAPDTDGLSDSGWGFGVAAEDFTNSGRVDVAVTNGFTGIAGVSSPKYATSQGAVYFRHFAADPLAFFVRDDEGRYVDVAKQIGLDDTGTGRALATLDYDSDGLLDLLINNADTGLRLFRNVTDDSERHWLDVALHDPTTATNPDGLGARIRLTTASGEVSNDWLTSNGSFETQDLPEAHFGLGAEQSRVKVEVWWPGESSSRAYDRIAVDRRVVLRR